MQVFYSNNLSVKSRKLREFPPMEHRIFIRELRELRELVEGWEMWGSPDNARPNTGPLISPPAEVPLLLPFFA